MDVYQKITQFFETTGWTIVTVLAVLAVGILLIRVITSLLSKALLKSRLEGAMVSFVLSLAKFALWLALIFIVFGMLKVPTAPLVTALGAAGLAVSLAIKDSLTNLANGLVLMSTKPFKAGDFVDIGSVGGTVKAIKMMRTELITPDNKKILIPNGNIISSEIINYSAKQTRRVLWNVSVDYQSSVDDVRNVVLQVLKEHDKILKYPTPMLVLDELSESSLKFSARAWVATGDYWDVFWFINEKLLVSLQSANIKIPYPQIEVSVKARQD